MNAALFIPLVMLFARRGNATLKALWMLALLPLNGALAAPAAVSLSVDPFEGGFSYSFFSDDPVFVSMGATSCLFIGAITISQTMKFGLTGCLQGVGAMKEVMTASIVSFSAVNLSVLAFTVFVLKMGVWGAWTGSLASQTVQALMLWRYTRKLDAFNESIPYAS